MTLGLTQCTILEEISSVTEGLVFCENEKSEAISTGPNTEEPFIFADNVSKNKWFISIKTS